MRHKIPAHLPAVLALGAVSQIGQVLFLRELLMVFHGNELSIGLILSAWLVWVGAGSRLGSILSEKRNRPQYLLSITVAGVALSLPATILIIRALRIFFDILPGAYLSLQDIATSCFLLMAPTCFFLGMQFVLLTRVWRESNRKADTSGAAKTYVGEAAGNMLGGLLFTFLIVRNLNAVASAVLIVTIMLTSCLLLTWKESRRNGLLRAVPFLPLLLAVVLTPFLNQLDNWSYALHWQNFSPQHRLIATRQSKHGTISILKHENQYSFFQSGNLVFSASGPESPDAMLENQDAILFTHLAMLQHEQPRNILLIGGGLRGVLTEITTHPVEKVDFIELDEVLTFAARQYITPEILKSLQDPRVHLLHTDGRLFVKTTRAKYDMVIVDVPDPATAVLNRFYTLEFFKEVEALLDPGGVFVIGAMSTPDLRDAAVINRNATIYHTMASVFSQVFAAGEQHLYFFASNTPGQIILDASALKQRYHTRDIDAEAFSSEYFHTILQETQIRRVNWIIRHHGRSQDAHLIAGGAVPLFAPDIGEQDRAAKELPPVAHRFFINSDFKPIGYFYTLLMLEKLTRSGQGEILTALLRFQFWWVALSFCLPLLAVMAMRGSARPQTAKHGTHLAVLFSVFTTGFSTMVLQIALLYSFQSIYGFIYEVVGMIIALFMFGLALGSFCAYRYIRDQSNIALLAKIQLLIAVIAALIGFLLPVAAMARLPIIIFMFFSIFTFTAGLVNGVDFPLSTACIMHSTGRPEKSAGVAYNMELIGACVGATLASVVVVPVWGIVACCFMASVANGTAFISLVVARRY